MSDDDLFDRLLLQLRRDEGWRLVPYEDNLGGWTIGCGHNLDRPISNAAVMQILHDDIDAVRDALGHFPWFSNLDPVRQGVLINMGFNLGINGLLGFRQMIAALVREDWEEAALQMLDSLWAGQVGQRAVRLASQMRIGIWQ
jgi:lysozyme